MNKYVIYTCIVGNYDTLKQPLVVDERFDYICFSNDIKEERNGVWEIRRIPYESNDNTRLSRYVKLLPHKVLHSYEYSIWLDANIQILDKEFYTYICACINDKCKIAHVNHPLENCIYDDMVSCIYQGKTKFMETYKQLKFLRKEGFPKNYGLYENNFIIRNHNDSFVIKISEEWFDLYMKYTKRDQFSLCYIYWKNRYKPSLILDPNTCTRNVNFMSCITHKKKKKKIFKRLLRGMQILINRVLCFIFIKSLL